MDKEIMGLKIIEYDEKQIVQTKLGKILYKKLLKIWNNKMWVLGIMEELYNNDIRIQKMIDIVDNGETDTDELGFLSEEI